VIEVRRGRMSALTTSAASELDSVARRTSWVRWALAAGAVLALALAMSFARGADVRPTSYFASGDGGIVVMDLSTSVERTKHRRIQRVVRSLAMTGSRVGLVVFSDSAYEALPPGTRGEELLPLLRFFPVPREPRSREEAERTAQRDFGITSPWSGTFRGGTRISTGLREARQMVERDRIADPSVLLLSDLDDAGIDRPALTQELIRYERNGIDLRIVPLFPNPEDRAVFGQVLGPEAFVLNRELLRNSEVEERQTLVGDFPLAFVLVAALLLALLALNERLHTRVSWGRMA
jgi:hypothetical protein